MRINMVGAFIRNAPFGTEIAFAKGMERRGHEVTRIDPSYEGQTWDMTADATLVFKWMDRYHEHLRACSGVKVLYQPDDARFPHIREMLVGMRPWVDHVLTFDQYGVDLARQLGYRDAEFMLLTADDELYCPSPDPIERDIDVSFIGSLTRGANHASRMRMCELVNAEAPRRGWSTCFGERYFEGGLSPVDVYRRSKIVLNHATDVGQPFGFGFGLQCRHFEVGMTASALLTNERPPHLTDGFADLYRFHDETDLIEKIELLLHGTFNGGLKYYSALGQVLYDDIRARHLPEHRADQLVAFIERNK